MEQKSILSIKEIDEINRKLHNKNIFYLCRYSINKRCFMMMYKLTHYYST